MKFIGISKSTNPKKKWDAHFVLEGDRKKKVSFGSSQHQDYTQHKDKERQRLYHARHAKDRLHSAITPGALSWYILWSAPTLNQGILNYKQAFGF